MSTAAIPDRIPQRRIGGSGPSVSVLALGSWHSYDRIEFADSVAMLREAVDRGVTMFDVGVYGVRGVTAPTFTDVLFSAIVRAAGIRREDYVFSAKLWLDDYPTLPLRTQLDYALFRAGIEEAEVAVLGDLPENRTIDLRRLVLDLAELISAGLIRTWGVNNWSATTVQQLIDIAKEEGVAGPRMAQLKYSVARRSIADGEPFARIFEQGVSLQSSDVMEGGYLLGKNGSGRDAGNDPGGIRERIGGYVDELRRVSESVGATPSQLCIAFTLTHPANVTTLFGCTSLEQLRDNLGAVDLMERVGAEALRELVAPFWADRGVVDPEGP